MVPPLRNNVFRLLGRFSFVLLFCCAPLVYAANSAAGSVFLEDLTSFELRAMVAKGATTVLVPIGGTEQNGPHMALGKHNVRVRALAGQIAQRLGNAVVAPVLGYVPEGSIFPPAAHMRFTGTISISDATFESILESTARSFKQHGFHYIVFLGDHGGYQKSEVRAADKINQEFAKSGGFRAVALTAYYEASQAPYIEDLRKKGFTDAEIGTHAGVADTSLMLAIDPSLVRTDLLAQGAKTGPSDGVYGDPRKASAELGQMGIRHIVDQSVQAIQEAIKQGK
jgi:creatinine amidohydrolase/Fe(II)-dependent formamide hydrolase-like protein